MELKSALEPYQADDGRVRIRPYCAEDVERLFEAIIASKTELMPFLPWCHPAYEIAETRTWVESRFEGWASGTEYGFLVEEVESGRVLGGNGLHGIGVRAPIGSLGYWMRSDAVGQGLTTAATRLVARFGFEVLGLKRLEILAVPHNLASRRVAEKLGAKLEGILRNRLDFRGETRDAACYSLLPGEL